MKIAPQSSSALPRRQFDQPEPPATESFEAHLTQADARAQSLGPLIVPAQPRPGGGDPILTPPEPPEIFRFAPHPYPTPTPPAPRPAPGGPWMTPDASVLALRPASSAVAAPEVHADTNVATDALHERRLDDTPAPPTIVVLKAPSLERKAPAAPRPTSLASSETPAIAQVGPKPASLLEAAAANAMKESAAPVTSLADAKATSSLSQRAFAFAELGVLGRGGGFGNAPAAPIGVETVVEESGAALSASLQRADVASAESGSEGRAGPKGTYAKLTSSQNLSSAHAEEVAGSAVEIAQGAASELLLDISGSDDAGGPALSIDRRASIGDARPKADLNVLLSENEEGGMTVVAATADMTPETGDALRRAASETLAEVGLSLTGFSLNGTVVKPRVGAGGSHGGRAR